MKFESKFDIGDLVEYNATKKQETNSFGFIVEVTFHKSDAVNFSAVYRISDCNTDAPAMHVYEHDIIKRYKVV